MREISERLNPTALKALPRAILDRVVNFQKFKRYGDIVRYFEEDDDLPNRKQVLETVMLRCAKNKDHIGKYAKSLLTTLLDDYIIWDTHWRARGLVLGQEKLMNC